MGSRRGVTLGGTTAAAAGYGDRRIGPAKPEYAL
jgi:hypothetical protein